MSAKPFLFLSYCQADADFALRLAADLKNQGVRVFADRLNVHPRENRTEITAQAFDHSAGLLPILSPDSLDDSTCSKRVASAREQNQPIIPLLLRPFPSDSTTAQQFDPHIDFTAADDYLKQRAQLLYTLRETMPECFNPVPSQSMRYLTTLLADLERDNLQALNGPGQQAKFWLDPDTWFLGQPFALLPPQETINALIPPAETLVTDIWALVENHRRILLVGTPGSGKSTILRQLALHAAWHCLAAPEAARIPLFINAANWPDGADAATFIRSHWPLDSDPINLLESGKAILFLDDVGSTPNGFDEAAQFQGWLNHRTANNANAADNMAIIATCSQTAYAQGLPLRLPAARMAPPARKWVSGLLETALGPEASPCALDRVIWNRHGTTHLPPGLQQYLTHPYLLPLLGRVCKEDGADALADYSVGKLVDRLTVELWEMRAPEATVAYEVLEKGLTALAVAAIRDKMPVYMPRDYAVDHLGKAALLAPVNSTGFLIVDDTTVRFAHYLLLLHFAARGLAGKSLANVLAPPHFNEAEQRIPRAIDPIIVMLAGLSDTPLSTVKAVAAIDPFLAMTCAYGGLALSTDDIYELARELLNSEYVKNQQGRVSAVELLPANAHQTGIPLLLDTMRNGSWAARRAATQTLLRFDFTPLPNLQDTLAAIVNEPNTSIRWIRQLGEGALPSLLRMLGSNERTLRVGAIRALGQLGDSAANPALVEALLDDDPTIQAETRNALQTIHDNSIYRPLADLVLTTSGASQAAIRETLIGFGSDALHRLLDLAEHDPDAQTRTRMISVLEIVDEPYIQARLAQLEANPSPDTPESQGRRTEKTMIKRLIANLDRGLFRGGTRTAVSDDVAGANEGLRPHSTEESEAQPLSGQSAQQARKRLEGIVERKPAAPALAETVAEAVVAKAPDDWTTRRDKVLDMGKKPAQVAIPSLASALKDPDSLVRVAAVQTLSIFSTEDQAMQALYTALGDDESLVCDTAADVLRAVGRPAIPYLTKALSSNNVNMRGVAVEKLGEIGDPSVIDPLADCLYDEEKPWLSEKRVCDLAAEALDTIGTRESLHIVLRWKAERAPDPKTAAYYHQASVEVLNDPEELEQQDTDDQLQNILNNLESADWAVRTAAGKELRTYAQHLKNTDREAPEFTSVSRQIVSATRDDDWTIRWAAAEALGWIANPATTPALVELLEDEHWIVRMAAVRSLVEIEDASVVPYITDLLEDPKDNVREAAAVAIGELGGGTTLAITRLGAALGDDQSFVQMAAIQSLGKLQDTTNLKALMDALINGEVTIRFAAAEALAAISAPESVPALIEALGDDSGPYYEEKQVRHIAAAALFKIDTPEAKAALDALRQHRRQAAPAN